MAHNLSVDKRALANIQGQQVKSKRLDASHQAPDTKKAGLRAFIVGETLLYQRNVAEEFLSGFVGINVIVVC